ncbi:hypothetical protein KQI65_01850 [bacterium]|nr:hypothetical protein [bacterium]
MKKIFVTMKRLRATVARVEREIQVLGLWHEDLEDTQVWLIPAHVYYGYTLERTGDIFIPCLSLSTVLEKKPWSLLDIVRHEWGHVLSQHLTGWEDIFDAEESVSPYGETNPDEDFAESCRFYLKHKGRLPKKWRKNDAIRQKWRYLQGL